MLNVSQVALFITGAFIIIVIPGPNILYLVARSIHQGRRAGFASVLGIEAATLVHICALLRYWPVPSRLCKSDKHRRSNRNAADSRKLKHDIGCIADCSVYGIARENDRMKKFRFKKIDAFAAGRSMGNPAGAVYLDSRDEITAEEMQRIARELKGFVSEVGYVWRINAATFGLKYYSSEREVEFCGHATIASLYDLISSDETLMKSDIIGIVTNKGKLAVENRIKSEQAVFITAPDPVFSPAEIPGSSIAGAFQIDRGELSEAYPVSIVNAGLQTLIVPLRRLKGVLSLNPGLGNLKQFCLTHSVDIITVFTDDVGTNDNRYRTRVFAPTFGYLEDPATGSGNAALGYYLLKNGKWDGRPISLEQNESTDSPNIVKLKARKNEDGSMSVLFGGGAKVRITGHYILI